MIGESTYIKCYLYKIYRNFILIKVWLNKLCDLHILMIEKIKIGVVGGGTNSSVGLAHLSALKLSLCYEISSGFFSRTKNVHLESQQLWDVEKVNFYDTYQSYLLSESKNIDCLLILTDTLSHYDILIKALELELPVICEKPLVSNYGQVNAISDKFCMNKNFLVTMQNYTGYPMVREIREWVTQQKLGSLFEIHLEMPQDTFLRQHANLIQLWRKTDDVIPGLHLDLGSHLLNLLDFINPGDAITKVFSTRDSYNIELSVVDSSHIMLKLESGVLVRIWFSKIALGFRNGLCAKVFGEKGSLIWNQESSDQLIYTNGSAQSLVLDVASNNCLYNHQRDARFKVGHPTGFIEAMANYYSSSYSALLNYLQGNDWKSNYIFSVDDATRNMKVLHLAEESYRASQWIDYS